MEAEYFKFLLHTSWLSLENWFTSLNPFFFLFCKMGVMKLNLLVVGKVRVNAYNVVSSHFMLFCLYCDTHQHIKDGGSLFISHYSISAVLTWFKSEKMYFGLLGYIIIKSGIIMLVNMKMICGNWIASCDVMFIVFILFGYLQSEFLSTVDKNMDSAIRETWFKSLD